MRKNNQLQHLLDHSMSSGHRVYHSNNKFIRLLSKFVKTNESLFLLPENVKRVVKGPEDF